MIDSTTQHAPQEVSMLSLVPKSCIGGAGISTIGAMSQNDVISIAGFGITALGFLVNLFYQYQRNKREEALNTAQISAIKKG
jgi:hypothetical protein